MSWKLNAIAIAFIIYGLLKVSIGIISLFLSKEVKQKCANIPIVNDFINDDESFAGLSIHAVLFIFGVFTLFHGLTLFNVFNESMTNFMESTWTHCILNGLIGVYLIVVFSLVLFTNVKISKDEKYVKSYELVGLGGGILFAAAVPAILLFVLLKNRNGEDMNIMIAMFLLTMIILLPFSYILFQTIITRTKSDKLPMNEFVTLLMIPMNFV